MGSLWKIVSTGVLKVWRSVTLAELTRPFPEGGVVEVELLERAQIWIAVIDVLLESRIAHAPDVLPVSAGQMSHCAPSVHLIAVASRDCHRADQRGQKDLPHSGDDVPVCCRLRIPSCREIAGVAGSLWEIASAVEKVVQVPRQKQPQTPCRLPHILYQSSNRRRM